MVVTSVIAGLLLAGACSSTTREGVGVRSSGNTANTATDVAIGDRAPTEGGPAPATGEAAVDPVTGAPTRAGTGGRSAAAISGRTAGGAAGGPANQTTRAPGVAPGGELKIGIHVSEDLQAAYAAFGAQGAEGDIRPAIEKVIAWINERGGFGGRKVLPVFHGSDALNGSFDSQAQAACARFTEDDPVFAVVSGAVLPTANLPDCMAKKRTPLVWNYHYLVDRPMWERYLPYLYMPFSISGDRLATVYADELVAAGFFSAGARAAIIRYDNPQHTRFATTQLRPRLQQRGVNVVEDIAMRQPPSAAAAGDTAAQIGNAILRLRGSQVSHVVFVPSGGAVPFIFMNEAESQGYRPRYGMNSLDIPYFVSDQAPTAQLAGAIAIGWSPASDTRREQQPLSGPRDLCYQLTNSQTAQRFCDGLFFLKAALDRHPATDAAGLQVAVEGLGGAFDPVFSLGTHFSPGRHDGASAIRVVAYDSRCQCFQYTGAVKPIG